MTPDEFVKGPRFLEAASVFIRSRLGRKPDPYNPDRTIPDPDHPDVIEVTGVLSSTSSVEQADAVRSEVITKVQLVLDDPLADVARGDTITTDDGRIYKIKGYPTRDVNAFSGWQPTLVCTLEEVEG